MTTPQCRLLSWRVADGPWQMAADEALLASALEGIASLRFYGWPAATLSLGYFQPAAVRLTDPLLTPLPWLRRPTGGEALVHHHEVTYALALPAGPPWQSAAKPWARRMHEIIRSALADLGTTTRLCEQEQRLGDVLCFLHLTPNDLLCGSTKVVGSAQRRPRGALLQHGSILLARSPHTPALPGLHELAGLPQQSEERVIAAVSNALKQETGWELVDEEWTASELRRAEELAVTRYQSDAWNAKR
jgi:lipoate-protein ligase A